MGTTVQRLQRCEDIPGRTTEGASPVVTRFIRGFLPEPFFQAPHPSWVFPRGSFHSHQATVRTSYGRTGRSSGSCRPARNRSTIHAPASSPTGAPDLDPRSRTRCVTPREIFYLPSASGLPPRKVSPEVVRTQDKEPTDVGPAICPLQMSLHSEGHSLQVDHRPHPPPLPAAGGPGPAHDARAHAASRAWFRGRPLDDIVVTAACSRLRSAPHRHHPWRGELRPTAGESAAEMLRARHPVPCARLAYCARKYEERSEIPKTKWFGVSLAMSTYLAHSRPPTPHRIIATSLRSPSHTSTRHLTSDA